MLTKNTQRSLTISVAFSTLLTSTTAIWDGRFKSTAEEPMRKVKGNKRRGEEEKAGGYKMKGRKRACPGRERKVKVKGRGLNKRKERCKEEGRGLEKIMEK